MKEVKGKIKDEIMNMFKGFYYDSQEKQLLRAQTINELIKAYHNTERPRYNKKPYYKKGGKRNVINAD